jgi:LysM repeat protein
VALNKSSFHQKMVTVDKNTRTRGFIRFKFATMRIFAFIVLFIGIKCSAQTSAAIDEYIENYQQLAIEEQLRTGIPAAITMAQAIHESGIGVGDLALKSNNHFGIKCKSTWTGDRVFHDDDESGECFRSYTSVADSYRDHSDFLRNNKRYGFLFNLNPEDYVAWAKGLKQAGYATNPRYPQILIKVIEDNGLAELTAMALGKVDENSVWVPTASTDTETVKKTDDKKNEVLALPAKNKVTPVTKSAEASRPIKQEIIKVNNCKAVKALKGITLTKIAEEQNISVADLLAYNDMRSKDKLVENQLVFLQEKKKKGAYKTHLIQKNETAWSISQQEGMQLNKLEEFNSLKPGAKLKPGQFLYLKKKAPK